VDKLCTNKKSTVAEEKTTGHCEICNWAEKNSNLVEKNKPKKTEEDTVQELLNWIRRGFDQ